MRPLLLIPCMGLAANAWAQAYVELGSSLSRYQNTLFAGSRIQAEQQIMGVLLGYEFMPDWSAEFITGLVPLSAKPVQVNGVEVTGLTMEFKSAFSLLVKRNFAVTPSFSVAARLGYTGIQGSGSYQGYSESFRSDGLSYGIGLRYAITPRTYLATDYLSLLDKRALRLQAVTLGVGYKF